MSAKIKLSEIKSSIVSGYLPDDFISELRKNTSDELVKTYHGEISLASLCICTDDGEYFHNELDCDEYGYDEYDDVYRFRDDLVCAYGRRCNEILTSENNCIYFDNAFYVEDYLSDNEIVCDINGNYRHLDDVTYCDDDGEYHDNDDLYYWESDGNYHLEPEDENITDNKLWDYGNGPTEKSFLSDFSPIHNEKKFGFGMEIEKNEMPDFNFNAQSLYDETGCVMETDGSVRSGFELKTPIYNLFSPQTDERLKQIEKFANVKNVENAGGHIGFSMEGKTDIELLNLCRGFLPLIYSMYKKRLTNTYCEAKKVKDLIAHKDEKFQSVRLRGNYIEFRIIASVKTFNTVKFRLELFRIIANNLGASFGKVLTHCVDINHPLHKLLVSDVYSDYKKFKRLIDDAIEINKRFGHCQLTQKTMNKITAKLTDYVSNKHSVKDDAINPVNQSENNISGELLPPPPAEINVII